MNILPKLISFQRLSKFLEQEGYSWVNLEKFEALAWNAAGKHAHLLCWGMCGIRDGVSVWSGWVHCLESRMTHEGAHMSKNSFLRGPLVLGHLPLWHVPSLGTELNKWCCTVQSLFHIVQGAWLSERYWFGACRPMFKSGHLVGFCPLEQGTWPLWAFVSSFIKYK